MNEGPKLSLIGVRMGEPFLEKSSQLHQRVCFRSRQEGARLAKRIVVVLLMG